MIPKIIHYCWFGGKPLPVELQQYVEEWKIYYPDFEVKCWNENTFDVSSTIFTKEAYSVGKYAFVADYVRMWAMYKYGGLYMDTDIKVLKRIDDYMHYRFFTAMEYHEDNVRLLNIKDKLTPEGYKKNKDEIITDICIESSIFAAEPAHPFIKDCLDHYLNRHFILEDGTFYDKVIIPVIMGKEADKYGFRYVNEEQDLAEGIHLLPDEYFTHPSKQTANTMALHMVNNSWKKFSMSQKIYAKLATISVIKRLYDILRSNQFVGKFCDYLQKAVWLRSR